MRWRTLAALTVSAALWSAAPALADVYTVTGFDDHEGAACTGTSPSFTCDTLRAAVAHATSATGDEVQLSAGTYQLDSPLVLADQDVTLVGTGARDTTLTPGPGGGHRLLTIDAGATLTGIGLRITGGSAADTGGDILNQGTLELVEFEVAGGSAPNGGGGIDNEGDLTLAAGLVANNLEGGGVLNGPDATFEALASTFAFNNSYGVSSAGAAMLWSVTIARNAGVGMFFGSGANPSLLGSIVADNGGGDCSAPLPQDGDMGGNVVDDASCGLTSASSKPSTDPQLDTQLTDQGGQSDVLTIPAGSPAVDIVSPCYFPIDQRLFARGDPCDAGAYEQSPALIASGPSGTTTSTSPSFTFQPVTDVTYECALAGPGQTGAFVPCTSPQTYSGLAPGAYTFTVRTVDPTGAPTGQQQTRSFTVAPVQASPTPTPTVTPTPTPTPTPSPTPVPGKSVVVAPVKGTVLVKKPGTNTFVEVNASEGIPLGSTIDTTHGTIQLTSQQTKNGQPQTAIFYAGQFKITQTKATTDLTLNQPLAACGKRAHAAAAKKKPKTRSLWGSGHGSFRTVGQYSAATVRGTKWFVQDSCAGTLTKVAQGVVSVRDDVRHKTILLKASKHYLARPRRS